MKQSIADAERIFGKIEFAKSERAKRIRVRISANGLKVSVPYHSSEKEALGFIFSEQEAICLKQARLKSREKKNPTIVDEETTLHTLTFDVILRKTARHDIYFLLKDGILTIEFPDGKDCRETDYQKQCWNGINYFLRKEAQRLLPGRTKQLAGKFGFYYLSVKIQPSKTRWGSCSRERNINLSYYLMLLPAHLVDYVILHELCHTKEMNHSDKFWAWMDKVTDGQSKSLRAELKKYNMPEV